MNKIAKRISKYKELESDIVDIDIKIEELENEIGITAQPQGERTSKTYKITSSVEDQALNLIEKKEELLNIKAEKERELKRIDNAMHPLTELERDIIKTIFIDKKRYANLIIKYDRSYSRLKQLERTALKRMEKYMC